MLTPEQIEALQQEVYNAADAENTKRLQTASQAAKDGGADLNWRNNFLGYTPVFIAANAHNEGCLSQLIAAGADVNATNDVGQSSLQVLGTDWDTTRYIIEDILQLLADRQKIERGREQIRPLLN